MKSSSPVLDTAFLLRKKMRAVIKQHIPINPNATPIPTPAFAPLLSPASAITIGLVLLLEAELEVPLMAEPGVWVAAAELVDELAKFQPFICTPWITVFDPAIVIVVGAHPPEPELMGVMT
jgi:hypothetical protein